MDGNSPQEKDLYNYDPLVNILVVDDDSMCRDIIINQLALIGCHRVIEASNGAEAHKFVLDITTRIDLIICDWEMPKADGLTLLRAVRKHKSRYKTPFIMVTSQASQERMKITKAKLNEVNGYIVKPFHSSVLREKVIELLEKAAAEEKKTGT
jgi:two-component system chemotaxis response regulator CheY